MLSGMFACIDDVTADNRGQVVLHSTKALQGSTVTTDSVQVFTAGADLLLGTADDVLVDREVVYDDAEQTITVTGDVTLGARYRVVLDSSMILDVDGFMLDGEFNGIGTPSGDGNEGGDFQIFTKTSLTEIVQLAIRAGETILGYLQVQLFRDAAPVTVQNFLNYANRGDWDLTLFHRLVTNFVIQGGGFSNSDAFTPITATPAIVNEPGISNTRGTIAMAKQAGNPNSATNQWFFNISDNGGVPPDGLDFQNGGFTVFGEIVDLAGAGGALLDTLAAFMTVNAAGVNGAFNQIPVVDPSMLEVDPANPQRRLVTPEDTINISRIALLMAVEGTPPPQLDTTNSLFFMSSDGTIGVRIFDLDQTGMLGSGAFVKVQFKGRNVNLIEFKDPMPDVRIGIQITGADAVNKIVDKRKALAGEITFIISNSRINSVDMKESLAGFDLTGMFLPELQFDDDIDGDGQSGDPLALYVGAGALKALTLRDGVTGDMVLKGGLFSAKVDGIAQNADLVAGLADSFQQQVKLQFGRVIDSNIILMNPVSRLQLTELINTDTRLERVEALSMGALDVRGDKKAGIAGDFVADLNLTAPLGPVKALGSAKIAGSIFDSEWSINGDAGNFVIKGDAFNWSLDVNGRGQEFHVRRLLSADIDFEGQLPVLNAVEWQSGSLRAHSMRNLHIKGDKNAGITGDFAADLTLTGTGVALGQATLHSGKVAGFWTVSTAMITGRVSEFIVTGDVSNVTFAMPTGLMLNMKLGAVSDSSINIAQLTRTLSVVSWTGGAVQGGLYELIETRGAQGVDGDFMASLSPIQINRLRIGARGDMVSSVSVRQIGEWSVEGDLRDSTVTLTQSAFLNIPSLTKMVIGGAMDTTELRSQAGIGQIFLGGMLDSEIYVGIPSTVNGFPNVTTGINTNSRLEEFDVRIPGSLTEMSMFNSFVVAGAIGRVKVIQPETENLVRPFGIAASTIDFLLARIGDQKVELTAPDRSLPAAGDFEVRIGFMPPPV